MKDLEYEELQKILSGSVVPEDGVYRSFFKEQEDSGWLSCTTYRCFSGGERLPSWIIDVSGKKISFSIRAGTVMFETCQKERFLNHVRSNTPDATDWVLFNLDKL
jgi:hypothetical protein